MYAVYTNILPADFQLNNVNLRIPYDAYHHIKTRIGKLENSVEYAAAGNTP